jgi:tryptophanyl-tRNA synthetase
MTPNQEQQLLKLAEDAVAAEKRGEDKGYGDFKKDLADVAIAHLEPVRTKMEGYRKQPKELLAVLDAGRDKAKAVAEKKMELVRKQVGLGRG